MTSLVLINSPIQRYSDSYRPQYHTTPALGLGYLATIARNAGIDTEIVDAEAEKLSVEETAQAVNELIPRTVGINMTSTNHEISLDILRNIDAPHKLVGGAHATLRGAQISAQNPDLLVVSGEADDIIVEALNSGRKGLVRANSITNLDRLPFIDRSLFQNEPEYIEGKCEASLVTSRGCPYSCYFCVVPQIFGSRVRSRSVQNVMAEISALKKQGIDSIHFTDDICNWNQNRLERMCASLKEMDIYWRSLARVELLDDASLEKMQESGCYKLSFGIETGVPRIARQIGKCDNMPLIKRVFGKCRELGIETRAYFTIGHPSETEAEIHQTIDFAEELGATDAYFMVVRAFPETRLYNQMLHAGFSREELDNYTQFQDEGGYVKYHVMNSRSLNGMSSHQLDGLIKLAYSRFYKSPLLQVA